MPTWNFRKGNTGLYLKIIAAIALVFLIFLLSHYFREHPDNSSPQINQNTNNPSESITTVTESKDTKNLQKRENLQEAIAEAENPDKETGIGKQGNDKESKKDQEGPFFSIECLVLDANKLPVPGAQLSLKQMYEEEWAYVAIPGKIDMLKPDQQFDVDSYRVPRPLIKTTDSKGTAVFNQIRRGAYLLTAWKLGYAAADTSHSFVYLINENRIEVDFPDSSMESVAKVSGTTIKTELHLSIEKDPIIFTGYVYNNKGEPVENAIIQARSIRIEGSIAPLQRSSIVATSDNNGYYSISIPSGLVDYLIFSGKYLKAIDLSLVAYAEGYAPQFKRYIEAVSAQVDFILDQGTSVSGIVISAEDDTPLPGVKVKLDFFYCYPKIAVSDDSGRFRFSRISSSSFRLNAEPFGEYWQKKWLSFSIENNESLEDIIIEMEKGVSFQGKVLSMYDKEPIEGATIKAANLMRSPAVETLTDKKGHFKIKSILPGEITVDVECDGYYGKKNDYATASGTNKSADKFLNLSETSDEYHNIYLYKECIVSGQVIFKEGLPVQNAKVHLANTHAFSDIYIDSGTTREDGFFEIRKVPGAIKYYLICETPASYSDGYDKISYSDEFDLEYGEKKDDLLVIIDSPSGSFSGRVEDGSGNSLESVKVTVYKLIEDKVLFKIAELDTNIDGRYEIDNISKGNYVIQAKAMNGVKGRVQIELKEAEMRTDVDITIVGSVMISGTVKDTDGDSVKDAYISEGGVPILAVTHERGRFQFEVRTDKVLNLQAEHFNYITGTLEVNPDEDKEIEIILQKKTTSTLKGRVYSSSRMEPVTKFKIYLIPEEYFGNSIINFYRSIVKEFDNIKGDFALNDIKSGYYALTCESKEFAPTVIRNINLTEGVLGRDMEIQMDDGCDITIGVFDAGTNMPVVNAVISLLEPWQHFNPSRTGIERRKCSSDTAGSAEMSRLAETNYRFRAEHPDYKTITTEPFEISKFSNNYIEIKLTAK